MMNEGHVYLLKQQKNILNNEFLKPESGFALYAIFYILYSIFDILFRLLLNFRKKRVFTTNDK